MHVTVRIVGSGKDVAHAVYYLVGTISRDGEPANNNYRTRVSQVFEKIDGKWLLSGAHFSPLYGGSGVPLDAFSSQNKR